MTEPPDFLPRHSVESFDLGDDDHLFLDDYGNWCLEHAESDDEDGPVTLYRFDVDQLVYRGRAHRLREGFNHVPWFEDDALPSPHKDCYGEVCAVDAYCKRCRSWAHVLRLSGVAQTHGTTVRELRRGFASDDPRQRAWAYGCVASHHGYENFDSYPLELSYREWQLRWGLPDPGEAPRTFTYHVNLNERGLYFADVRDPDGETVFTIKVGYGEEEDTHHGDVEDYDVDDLDALRDHLMACEIMSDDDTLEKA